MEKHVRAFLNRTSVFCSALATAILFYLLLTTTTTTTLPTTCVSHPSAIKFPNNTCDPSHHPRTFTTLETRNRRIWATSAWTSSVKSYTHFFLTLQRPPFSLLTPTTTVLSLLAGAGQEVLALHRIGVVDVTGVDLVDSPPLVNRADPNKLPFFDGVFDLAFCAQFDVVLFPDRVASEMQRTVKFGGHCVVVIDGGATDQDVRVIAGLFRKGKMVGGAVDVVLNGAKMKMVVVRVVKSSDDSSDN